MNNTERPITDQIISSGVIGSTERNDGSIISSNVDIPQIISSSLSKEVILNGIKYGIVKQIARSGESEIYLVSQNGNNFVFKYYYSQYKPKDEILSKLKGLKHPDIICLLDHGYYQERFFEISEYAQGGTIQEIMPVNSILNVKEIVSQTVEALNYCHSHGIIHRDIKPENIFYRTPDKKDIVIGDFGIASNVKEGEEDILTTQARTNLYAAPELFSGIKGKTLIEKSVDYYALGITLLHLWFGRNPFEDIDEYSVMRLKSEGRILFPDDIDHEVQKLIKGLITVNPRDRWAYNEVKRWLKGEDVKVNYQTVQFDYKPYSFGMINGEQIVVNTPKDLTNYLEKYPEKGEGHLYRNTIAKWIEPIDAGLFNELMDIVEKDYPRDKTAGLTKAIYILDPDKPFKVLNGIKLSTQEEIALHFEQHFEHYEKDLQNPNASFYVFLEAKNYKDKANEYRGYFKTTNAEAALNALIFELQGADKYLIDNYTIYQPEELLKVDDITKVKVIKQLSNINSKLSLWIAGFQNLQPTIDKWRLLKRYDEVTLRYAFQQGYEFQNNVSNNEIEFYSLFETNFSSFFSDVKTNDNKDEVNYWLVNYADSSLPLLVSVYLDRENYSDNELIQMLLYVLREHKEINDSIYLVIKLLLPRIKAKIINNSELFNNVIQIHQVNIEDLWKTESKTKSVRFLDCLINYLSFAEKNINSFPIFFVQLTCQLNNNISNGIHQDIDRIKGDENLIKSYRNDLHEIVKRLEKIETDLPVVKQYHQKNALIKKSTQEILKKNAIEKQGKIDILSDKYSEIVDQKKKEIKANFSFSWNNSTYDYIIPLVGIIGAVLGIIIESNNTGQSGFERFFGYILMFIVWGILGLVAGLPIKYLVNDSAKSSAYDSRLNDTLSKVNLSSQEQDAFNESKKGIDKFFEDKESFETFQETVRILVSEQLKDDVEQNEKEIINESKTEESTLNGVPIFSLRTAIGLNDRALFLREIFENNTFEYNNMIDHLDKLETIQQAVEYLTTQKIKIRKNETGMKFIDLVKQRFTK